MKIQLHDFSYYFSLTGVSGGLASMDCKFKPLPDRGEDINHIKAATREVVGLHTDVLDRVYDEAIVGKRQPIMSDTPHSVSTGYKYQGRLAEDGLPRLSERLRTIFGDEAVDPRGELSVYLDLRSTVECSFGKMDTGLGNVDVVAKYQMNHVLNVCFFHFTQRLESSAGIEVAERPRKNMNELQRLLETTTTREGLDYFEMVTK